MKFIFKNKHSIKIFSLSHISQNMFSYALCISALFMAILAPQTTMAWIPRPAIILQKTCENAGSGLYQIEQELQFQNGGDTLTLKETWLIENENNMKLLVTSTKDQANKDSISFFVQYTNGVRSSNISLLPNHRNTDEFLQKYFFIRSSESLAQVLQRWEIANVNSLLKKPGRTGKDSNGIDESYLRLSRTGGVVAYAFGTPSQANANTPGLWIEQDQFVIRKLRLPTQTELVADRFSTYSRNLNYPRIQTVRWGNNSVTIQTLSVSTKNKDIWASFGGKSANIGKLDGLIGQPANAAIEDFYKRFR